MAYYNGKKVLSVVEVKEVEIDYYVGCATLENEKKDEIIVPSYIQVGSTNFPILENTKTSLVELGGNSQSFNQLVNYAYGRSVNTSGITITNNNDGSFTIKGKADAYVDVWLTLDNTQKMYASHKYLLYSGIKGGSNSNGSDKMGIRSDAHSNVNMDIGSGSIGSPSSDTSRIIVLFTCASGFDMGEGQTIRPQIFDLTSMGLENITSGEEFKALFPLDYYPHNEGEVISTIVSKIESWGYNLLNLNRVQGDLVSWEATSQRTFKENEYYFGLTANNYYSPTTISNFSKTDSSITFITNSTAYGVGYPIKVVGGRTYILEYKASDNSTTKYMSWYDKNGNFISFNRGTGTFTAPNNAYWGVVIIRPTNSTDSVSYSDICLHDSSINLDYKPYVGKLGTITFPNALITLNGINNIHDTLTFEEQADGTYNAILTRKIGVVDLGTLGWATPNTLGRFNSLSPLTVAKAGGKGICYKYLYSHNAMSSTDMNIYVYDNNLVYITDTSLIDKTEGEIKAYLSGVLLFYELATPTTETIATGLTFDEVSTLFEKGGTIKVNNANTDYVKSNITMAFAVRRFKTTEE